LILFVRNVGTERERERERGREREMGVAYKLIYSSDEIQIKFTYSTATEKSHHKNCHNKIIFKTTHHRNKINDGLLPF
jgi:hypothetical protein